MIPFQFRTFQHVLLSPQEGIPLTAAKRLIRAGLGAGFLSIEAVNAALLSIDPLLFPELERTAVDGPVFIIGNPRSGTTFLQRLMGQDEEQFSAVRTWELIFPSLTAQAMIGAGAAVDAAVGGPIARLIKEIQESVLKPADAIHRTRLDSLEEDDGFLVHAFASGFLAMLFPSIAWGRLQWFDEMPDRERRALMAFYRACIQRHLAAHGRGRRLLSKNALFGSKIRSVYETFPDARVVYLVRDPADSLSSLHDMMVKGWRARGIPVEEGSRFRRPGVLMWARYVYSHALQELDRAPAGRAQIVRYDDLVADPKGTVERIYRAFDLPISDRFRAKLEAEAARARQYRSEHRHSLEHFGLTRQDVATMLPEVYARFDFPR